MKTNFAIWMVIGIGTGTLAGVIYNNLPAGITLGTSFGMLVNLFMWLNVFKQDNK